MEGFLHSQQGLSCRNMLRGLRVLKYGDTFAEHNRVDRN